MISSFCQGLQSHVESQVLSFQLFPQESSHYYSSRFSTDVHRKCEVEENNSKHGENGENGAGWSFLEAVSNGNEEDKVYVHPLVKNSSTKLSKKSLEMCTESLGSESGSDMGENDISLLTLQADDSRPNNARCSTWMHKKAKRRDTTFPPPLTSISGSTGVRVESYREDGRLVLRAVVSSTSCSRYFHAERSQGRLILQLVKHREEKTAQEDSEVVEQKEEVFGDDDDDDDDLEEVEEEEPNWPGDEETTEENDGEEIGMENFGRPRSCRSSSRRQSKELLNWEGFHVNFRLKIY